MEIAWRLSAGYPGGRSTPWALVSYLEYLNSENRFSFIKWIVLNIILFFFVFEKSKMYLLFPTETYLNYPCENISNPDL